MRKLLILVPWLPAVGLSVLWARSYFATDSVGVDVGNSESILASSTAHVSLWVGPHDGTSGRRRVTFYSAEPCDLHDWSAIFSGYSHAYGFGFGRRRGPDTYTTFTVPFWPLLLLASFVPLDWSWHHARVRVAASHHSGSPGFSVRQPTP